MNLKWYKELAAAATIVGLCIISLLDAFLLLPQFTERTTEHSSVGRSTHRQLSGQGLSMDHSFVAESVNTKFTLPPNDPAYIDSWKGVPKVGKTQVKYMREFDHIKERGDRGNCTNAIQVLGYIMDEVNEHDETMMIAYGGLIHLLREKDFVNKHTGKYIDDDIDTFASIDTVRFLGNLEPELFAKFGWTTRVFLDDMGYVVFMQILASCRHTPTEKACKVRAAEPPIEVYPLAQSIPSKDGKPMVKDIWQVLSYPASMMFPSQQIRFESAAAPNRPLHLQIPNKSHDLLEGLYGDWMTPSSAHALRGVAFGDILQRKGWATTSR
jgi:hypothetical protein